ncbi:MAG: S8 family serine peptidase, partial [Bdellovibrionota bacterium]
ENPATGADIRAVKAWSYLKTKPESTAKVRVAIIDTGIDLGAKEFTGRIDFAKSYNFIGGNLNIQDFNGHGSHVAGVIGASHDATARIRGVNPNVQLVIYKALTMYGFATSGSILKSLDAALKTKVRVINASYGSTSYDKAEFEALDRLRKAGVLFVAAAGNNSTDTDKKPFYPADYTLSNILSVGASTRNDEPAKFSNYGETSTDVFAPGADIRSTIVKTSFTNRREVFTLAMKDTKASEWTLKEASGVGFGDAPWKFVSCGDRAGSCLRFKPPSGYSPSAKFDFFNYRYTKSVKSDPEKHYVAVSTAKYDFPTFGWEHETTGSVLAGDSDLWMLPADYVRGNSTGWTEMESDLSEPGLFYSGTTAWDHIALGYSANFSRMSGYPDYKRTEFLVESVSIYDEEPVAKPALANFNGTSMAAPHVTGMAAWLVALDPSMTPEKIKAKIIATCDPVASMKTKSVCGGRVNLDGAVR